MDLIWEYNLFTKVIQEKNYQLQSTFDITKYSLDPRIRFHILKFRDSALVLLKLLYRQNLLPEEALVKTPFNQSNVRRATHSPVGFITYLKETSKQHCIISYFSAVPLCRERNWERRAYSLLFRLLAAKHKVRSCLFYHFYCLLCLLKQVYHHLSYWLIIFWPRRTVSS